MPTTFDTESEAQAVAAELSTAAERDVRYRAERYREKWAIVQQVKRTYWGWDGYPDQLISAKPPAKNEAETVRMSAPVTDQYLLEGAVYSLERCGQLLCDARSLFENGSYATAVVLARFACENLGQWQILRDLWKQVGGGAKVTIDEVRDRCKDHVDKQRAGMMSLTMRADKGTGVGKLLEDYAAAAQSPASKEFKDAHEQLAKIDQQKQRRTPDQRHNERMSALYVDPISPTKWNRPVTDASKRLARDILTDALNDYSIQLQQRYTHPELCKLLPSVSCVWLPCCGLREKASHHPFNAMQ
jgi:AbiV family abortive infection protein